MPLNSKINVSVDAALTAALDLATGSAPLSSKSQMVLANGTGAGQANVLWHDRRTLAASATEDLDLAGSLTNAFGAAATFARVKVLLVKASSANANNVEVGGAASNAFVNWVGDATDVVVVRPGGLFLLAASDATAYAVTASTGDLLTITNSSAGTGVTYDIVIIGCSA